MEVQVYELWQRELDDSVDFAGGIAVWEDGTIWLGSQDTHLWEMNAQGELLRAVTASREASNRGRALALSSTPDRQGAVLVSSNGTTIYPGRRAEGGYTEAHRRSVAGIATFEGGDYVLSYTPYSDDGHAGYAVHRYSLGGDLLARWHPVYSDDDWQVTSWMSGGPVAVTRAGDLLFSPRVPPFLVVRYPGGYPDAAAVLVEDETIVSREELRRALARRGRVPWNRPVVVDALPDGNILTVVRYYPRRQRSPQGLWVVVAPEGDILTKTRFREDYRRITPAGTGNTYLAYARHSRSLVALTVTVLRRIADS